MLFSAISIHTMLMERLGLQPVVSSSLQSSLPLTCFLLVVSLWGSSRRLGQGYQTRPVICYANPTKKTFDFNFYASHSPVKPQGHKSWHSLIPERMFFKLIKKQRFTGKCVSLTILCKRWK